MGPSLSRRATTLAVITAVVALTGCDTAAYYAQAFRGQAEMWQATRPIDDVMSDPEVPAALKERLQRAARIREFASQELGLPDNRTYRGYADLKRPYVVWNVFAAEPLSVKPRQWCFPIAGCVAYKGFFSRADADAQAATLRAAGDDVFIGGVPAYSTLGFLNDPVLNTFIHYPPAELARLIFHELAHQVVYVRDDTEFNESFAVAVEREGVRRWMDRYGLPAELEVFNRAQQRRAAFQELASRYRERLEKIYASVLSADEKLVRKREVFAELAAEYESFKQSWNGFKGYDPWLGPDANNASLASISVYTQLVPAFQALLEAAGNDLPGFYGEVRRYAAMPKEERRARLAELRDARVNTSFR